MISLILSKILQNLVLSLILINYSLVIFAAQYTVCSLQYSITPPITQCKELIKTFYKQMKWQKNNEFLQSKTLFSHKVISTVQHDTAWFYHTFLSYSIFTAYFFDLGLCFRAIAANFMIKTTVIFFMENNLLNTTVVRC